MLNIGLLITSLLLSPAPESNSLYLAIGGGNQSYHSQAVLELNLKLFSKAADEAEASDDSITYLFGAGSESDRLDVIEKKKDGLTAEELLFADLFPACREPDCFLRHNNLDRVDGPSTRSTVLNYLDQYAEELTPKDNLRIYFTGHGSYTRTTDGPKDFSRNTLLTWNDETINAVEFASSLDKIDPAVQIQVVMVQCFSGGFAQINYSQGDPARGLSKANRCGFYSQLKSRLAAGCTPDLDRREEYSPYFYSALRGESEKGDKVDADYDGNGSVSSDEAHAYVIIHEKASDVPVSTSSELLRDIFPKGLTAKLKGSNWEFISSTMNKSELAVAYQLGEELKIEWGKIDQPYLFVSDRVDMADRAFQAADAAFKAAQKVYQETQEVITQDLYQQFPIFKVSYGADQGNLKTPDAKMLEAAKLQMLAHPFYAFYAAAGEGLERTENDSSKLENFRAKWERLKYLLGTKLSEVMLAKSDKKPLQEKYQQLKACESDSFFK